MKYNFVGQKTVRNLLFSTPVIIILPAESSIKMKGNVNHNNLRLWNIATLALFIVVMSYLRLYMINATDSSFIGLIMDISIIISTIGLIAYIVEGYMNYRVKIKSAHRTIKADSTLTEPISQDDAELIRQTEEENKRRKEEQWAEIASYTKATFHKIFTPTQIEILLNNMKELTGDEIYIAVETGINRHLKSDDLLHFGWNVSKRLLSGTQKKLGVTTALFLKKSFPMTLSGYDIGNIPSKLRVENFKVLPLINPTEPLVPYVFPDTENLPVLA